MHSDDANADPLGTLRRPRQLPPPTDRGGGRAGGRPCTITDAGFGSGTPGAPSIRGGGIGTGTSWWHGGVGGQGRREAAAVNAPALQAFAERVLAPVWRVDHASGSLCVEVLVLGADGSVRDVITAAIDAARAQAVREGASGDGGLLHLPATRLAAYTYALMVAPPAVSATLGDIDKPVSPSVIVADPTAAEESAAVAATSVTVVVVYDESARAMPYLHHLECVGAPAAPPLIQQCIDLSLKAHHPATDA
eukprot:ctg_2008.g555